MRQRQGVEDLFHTLPFGQLLRSCFGHQRFVQGNLNDDVSSSLQICLPGTGKGFLCWINVGWSISFAYCGFWLHWTTCYCLEDAYISFQVEMLSLARTVSVTSGCGHPALIALLLANDTVFICKYKLRSLRTPKITNVASPKNLLLVVLFPLKIVTVL